MSAQAVTALLGAIAIAGQLVNLVLYLKIRVGQLETEKSILAQVRCEYRAAELCDSRMADHERRIEVLEEQRA